MRPAHAVFGGLALLLGVSTALAQDAVPDVDPATAVETAPATMPEAAPEVVPEAVDAVEVEAEAEAPAPAVDQSAAVMAVVTDFHQAIEEGYRDGVVRLLDENLIVFETGYVEASRDEYIGGHLDADLQYAVTVKRKIIHSQTMVSGNVAVVLSQTRSKGEFAGKNINLTNTETMVLRLGPDGWKIAHIHWSGHELKDVPPAQ